MDHVAPPIAAFENLTITDSFSPPINALVNLTISESSNTSKPATPKPKVSREESCRLANLRILLAQYYGTYNSRICFRFQDPSYILSPALRMSQYRFRYALVKSPMRGNLKITRKMGNSVEYEFNTVRSPYIREKINRLLSNMAEKNREHRDKFELAKRYIEQGEKQEEVLSIVKSLY
ncbi:hypothetical protein POM88_006244 [Heracleum sosnowskyi]|uniref:Uncharacterized protein n=1 Tax=Heracleum sosnowskyi TaxID=360622 RepID=A0AAD8J351_9APIA|nr:hypothetical protein POM88_006244 [Heracleum sosnowskyi]